MDGYSCNCKPQRFILGLMKSARKIISDDKIPIRRINEPDLSESFNIREVATMLSGKNMVEGLHRHDFFFVLMLEKGRGEHLIDFKSYPVENHSVFFLQPGQVHQLALRKGSTGYLMQISRSFFSSRKKQLVAELRRINNHYQLDLNSFKRLLSIVDYIFQEHVEKEDRYQDVIKANLRILFIELARQGKNSRSIKLYAQERLEEFLELIEKHISTIKQVAEYADMLHLTPYQLNAITKATLGKAGSELINEHIVLEAKRHLLATTRQVNQIASDLGYDDFSYFIRFFKKHTGDTPQAFREKFSHPV